MGVSPIDLQTMYANMNNIARTVAHQQQGAVLAQQLQESKIIQQNAEKAATVHKAADNEAKSSHINDEGHHSDSGYGSHGKKRNPQKNDDEVKTENELRETYLGRHINIER
ncbi:hypothetical protein [uncultured Treponema sp.]|uniref:hypothetical protein n=1 Tax=uncultured Treponema sp. TaxID=162155 RepID=UPI0025E9CE72|nr:hypothetical protein [uncultured Treponema sp.]